MTISQNLRDVATMTAELRHLDTKAAEVGGRRARAALKHHAHGVTYQELAEAMGVSLQMVFKILRRAAKDMGHEGIKDAAREIRESGRMV